LAGLEAERYHCLTMTAKLGPLIRRAADALNPTTPSRALGDVEAWLDRLTEWNTRIDLTAARSPEELVDLMLADALVLSPRISPDARVVDVGTGGGAPGLAIALLRPDLKVTLVEPLGKRASFLRTALGTVGRSDVRIERVRGEALAGRRAWDAAVSRATLAPGKWLELGVTLASPGGSVWVLLAQEDAPRGVDCVLEEELAYEWPLTGAKRRAARYLATR
jgi:16S rRNA (guanine527-N7)-methyltransferase